MEGKVQDVGSQDGVGAFSVVGLDYPKESAAEPKNIPRVDGGLWDLVESSVAVERDEGQLRQAVFVEHLQPLLVRLLAPPVP